MKEMSIQHGFYSLLEELDVVLEKEILHQVELATIYSITVLHFSLITNTFPRHCWRLRNDWKKILEADSLQAVSAHCSVLKSACVSTNGHVVIGVNIIPCNASLFFQNYLTKDRHSYNSCCQHHFTPLLFQGMHNMWLLCCSMDFRMVPLWKRGERNKTTLLLSLGCQRIFWDIL